MSFDISNPDKPTWTHDPDAVLDYTWGFSLDTGDTIATVEFVVPAGAAITPGEIVGMTAVGWLSITDKPGLTNKTIGVTCRYHSVSGRIDDRTFYFKIKER